MPALQRYTACGRPGGRAFLGPDREQRRRAAASASAVQEERDRQSVALPGTRADRAPCVVLFHPPVLRRYSQQAGAARAARECGVGPRRRPGDPRRAGGRMEKGGTSR
jgi:hypothetical protein